MLEQDTVSIKYTLTLTDGTEVAGNLGAGPYLYTPDRDELIPALEEVLRGMAVGEKRELHLSHEMGDRMRSDIARLAMLLGHPGQSLIFNVEVVDIAPPSELEPEETIPIPGLGRLPKVD